MILCLINRNWASSQSKTSFLIKPKINLKKNQSLIGKCIFLNNHFLDIDNPRLIYDWMVNIVERTLYRYKFPEDYLPPPPPPEEKKLL